MAQQGRGNGNGGGRQERAQVVVEDDGQRSTNPQALSMLARSEIEAQIDTARKYPRDLKRFQANAVQMATMNADVAEACLYSLPRRDQEGNEIQIVGPSVRLAEILTACYGNIHSGARIVDEGAEFITAQGACWDLETNNKVQIESQRRITTKSGRRYGADMIMTTGNAAIAIAYRNAVFKVIPRAYIDIIFDTVKASAVGDEKTLAKRRQEVIARLGKSGVHPDRVFARLKKTKIEEVDRDDVAMLIGLGTSIKDGVLSIDEAFPMPVVVPAPEQEGQRVSVVQPQGQPAQAAPPAQAVQPTQTPPHLAEAFGQQTPPPQTTQAAPPPPAPPEEPPAPDMDPDDAKIRDAFVEATTKEGVNLAANLLVTARNRIGSARYKALYSFYEAAKNRVGQARS